MEGEERSPAMRVSDADRERAAGSLGEHAAAGRLTFEELSERLDRAYAARTQAELDAISADLPAPSAPRAPARRKRTRWIVALMSGTSKRGRWRLGEHTAVVTVMGGAYLDLRGAELDAPETTITCVTFMGGIAIVVPEGVEVDVTGFALFGGRNSRVPDPPRRERVPLVRVRAFAFMGGIDVSAKRRWTRAAEDRLLDAG